MPEGVSPSPCPTHIKIFLDRVSRFLKVFLIFQEVSLYPNVGAIMGEGVSRERDEIFEFPICKTDLRACQQSPESVTFSWRISTGLIVGSILV